MTEEYWAEKKKKDDLANQNILWQTMDNMERVSKVRNMHPDKMYAICRTDNPEMRFYRASPKLGIDELAMMICRDVGCDLQYCQMLFHKPKHADQ